MLFVSQNATALDLVRVTPLVNIIELLFGTDETNGYPHSYSHNRCIDHCLRPSLVVIPNYYCFLSRIWHILAKLAKARYFVSQENTMTDKNAGIVSSNQLADAKRRDCKQSNLYSGRENW